MSLVKNLAIMNRGHIMGQSSAPVMHPGHTATPLQRAHPASTREEGLVSVWWFGMISNLFLIQVFFTYHVVPNSYKSLSPVAHAACQNVRTASLLNQSHLVADSILSRASMIRVSHQICMFWSKLEWHVFTSSVTIVNRTEFPNLCDPAAVLTCYNHFPQLEFVCALHFFVVATNSKKKKPSLLWASCTRA